MQTYELRVAGLTRHLPLVRVAPDTAIASFVILGDAELVTTVAPELVRRLPPVDWLLTPEAKGIPLVYEMARLLGMPRYIVARKSVKPYMQEPVVETATSITTQKEQVLVLDGREAREIRGKRVAIIDDVISTGQSVEAAARLLERCGAQVAARACILAEGDAARREDLVYLEELPLFPVPAEGEQPPYAPEEDLDR